MYGLDINFDYILLKNISLDMKVNVIVLIAGITIKLLKLNILKPPNYWRILVYMWISP